MKGKGMSNKETNRDIRASMSKDQWEVKVEQLVKLGVVEIVDCEEDGSPIVRPTSKGIELYKTETRNE